jgi:Hsp70 protein
VAVAPDSAELEAALREFLVEAPKLESVIPEPPAVEAEIPLLEPLDAELPLLEPLDADIPLLEPLDADIPMLVPLDAEIPLLEPLDEEIPLLEPLSVAPESVPVSFNFDLPVPPSIRRAGQSEPSPFHFEPESERGAADLGLPAPGASQPPAAPPQRSFRPAPLLIDVTPISLGVEVAGGFCDFLIRANTPVPCDRTRIFRTASDAQTAVRVRVVQGESEKFSENTYLGDLELTGLRPAPRGEVEIAVTFEIDADGILNVRAKEEASGRETVARMNLLGAQTDTDEVAAMMARQRRHDVA